MGSSTNKNLSNPKLGTMFKRVHCHICPLKDLCPYQASQLSWEYQRWLTNGESDTFGGGTTKLDIATRNCPLLQSAFAVKK
jgi:hypothetical protein